MLTIKTIILSRFRKKYLEGNNGFINGQVIEDKIHNETGKKHATVNRTLRLMAKDGTLEKTIMTLKDKGQPSVWYKYIPSESEKKSLLFRTQNKLL